MSCSCLSHNVQFSEECLVRGWTVTEPPTLSCVSRVACGSGVRGMVYRKSWKGSARCALSFLNAFSTALDTAIDAKWDMTVDDKPTL